jgi:hopanoid biosynthesis associated radical SAM protein HpnH
MAGYIFKNKFRPRPEWQKHVAPKSDAGNPFRILPAGSTEASVQTQPHPLMHKRFPIVMMLEPLHACNLTCTGCGRIREYESTITERVPLEECLMAVDECGAPVVSICGGEPMMYPQIGELVAGILERNRHIILCTNGMFIKKRLHEFKPDSRFYFNVHLTAWRRRTTLRGEGRRFPDAIEGIKVAKAAGFKPAPIRRSTRDRHERDRGAVRVPRPLGVDGHQISPATATPR